MSDIITVGTSTSKSYNIQIGKNLEAPLKEFIRKYSSEKVFVVVDEFVLAHHKPLFEEVLRSHFTQIHIFEVPRGESSKSISLYHQLMDFILNKGADRNTPLVAIGGGVTGDLAGFAAATVLRGIPLIHISTTMLAMVDSAIGGKTGINHSTGKNLIGSFYQPDAVFSDVRYLQTLPEKEWVNGLSEVLKYGMIHNPEILKHAKELIEKEGFSNSASWLPLIEQSARIKADIVSEDVLEAGKRAFLNFGHTFAHVIEREGNYKEYSHGEAVFAGMIAAVHASNLYGAQIEISNLLSFRPLYSLSMSPIQTDITKLVEAMRRDKKAKDDQIRLILLHEIGKPYVRKVDNINPVEEAWEYIFNLFE